MANGLKAKGLKAKGLRPTNRLEATDRLETINNLKAKNTSSKERLTSRPFIPPTNETRRCNQHAAGESSVRTVLGVIGNPLIHF